MLITEEKTALKNKFKAQVTLKFSGNLDEIKQLLLLLVEEKLDFNTLEGKITAVVPLNKLRKLILKWPDIFGMESDRLKEILQENSVFFTGAGFSFDITTQPLIYSIVNVTPDSFYDGGVNNDLKTVLKKIELEQEAGATFFELGGKSSKPNFVDISAEEEWQRIAPYIKEIKRVFPDVILALDSNTDSVVERALSAGVQIINDIDGFVSEQKLRAVSEYKPAVVTMFNGRNNLEKTQHFDEYLKKYFEKAIVRLTDCGLKTSNIVLDPGVGFSKTNVFEFDLLKVKVLRSLVELGLPLMVAISRKSFMSKLFNLKENERLLPTLLFESQMVQQGGRLLRVHDVKETKEMLDIYKLFEEF
ncbi:dihydropteroate synthase [Liquorilactobacillus capillatus]|uniref:Dihydropteroate synthase n=1 Tax=Liquorilactobacillus capillatus DSM 19910 TaxID=1423731 RepID=A0A0R1M8E6_9LACO|nr:dihydropteroate synthase [Liquorilactobacillus capillatus]KRL01202.1 dihydropteroate synthase [Liquorilactobacillus capillatus DSM 19910]